MAVEGQPRRGGRHAGPGRRPGQLALGATPPWWRARRSQRVRVAMAVVLALVAAGTTWSMSSRADHVLAGYGSLRRVPVARHDLAEGHAVATVDIQWRDLPVAAVPTDAVDASPVGRLLVDRVAQGEVIGRLHLAPDGLRGLAALVPAGRRAVAVPQPPDASLDLAVADRVDVIAPTRASGGLSDDGGTGAQVVARAAAVLEVSDRRVVVAVTHDEAAALADALARGQPVLALVGPG